MTQLAVQPYEAPGRLSQEPQLREDDELLAEVLDGARRLCCARAQPELASRQLEAADAQAREIGAAVGELSQTLRNWATHIPWAQLAALRAGLTGERGHANLSFVDHRLQDVIELLAEIVSPSYLEQARDPDEEFALDKNSYDFYRPAGSDLLARTQDYLDWVEARRRTETWQYSRTLEAPPGNVSALRNDVGRLAQGINYNSQDYLSLNMHEEVREAVVRAIREFGPHSAGSPMVLGNTRYSTELEELLGDFVGAEHVMLFPTGWAAGFGSVVGLVRQDDHVVLDWLSHACLQQGARAATRNIVRYPHLDVEAAGEELRKIRARDAHNGILVITDGLFSVDSDYCDLARLQALCHEYGATLMVDVAHDLGSMGPDGTGVLGLQGMLGKVDLVMGSFSKVFASNGGFLASRSPAVKQYVKMFSGTHLFSNALAPAQAAAALRSGQIIRSPEGAQRRAGLLRAVTALRDELTRRGLTCMGTPSAIVPLLIGNEKLARIAHRKVFERNVLAFMVEFPVAPTGAARFRLQVQASHTEEQGRLAAKIFDEVLAEARSHLSSAFGTGLC